MSVATPSTEVTQDGGAGGGEASGQEGAFLRSLLVIASLGAAAIHFAFAPAHLEEQTSHGLFFLAVAWLQMGWAFAVFRAPSALVYRAGIALNLGVLAVWLMSRTVGIDGEVEPFGLADSVAAGLEAFVVLGSLAPIAKRANRVRMPELYRGAVVGAVAVAVAALVSVSMTPSFSGHTHGEAAHGHTADGHVDTTVAAAPFDPAKPVDLSGTAGVTAEQQAAAEALVVRTLRDLPQWADQKTAEAAGFKTIGDGFTGTEHLMNRKNMDDDVILDPNKPESLVYDVDRATGKKTLAAAMYMVKEGTPLADVPDVGGALMQWHIHNNLCYNDQGRVSGLTRGDGTCAPGLVKPPETPMIHVWIRPNECGPFAALEGVGAGAVADGETRLCDHAHGSQP